MTSPDEPLDEHDRTILAGVKDLWTAADPMPAGLLDRVKFAIELENVDLEVLRLTEVQPAAARGDEQSRLITFDSESVTIMVSIRPNPDGTIRVDGWLTPAGRHPIELRSADRGTATETTTVSDEDGRFVLDTIQPGLAQLIVRPTGSSRTVTTPSISL
ncbi:hypothetical protein JOF56_000256 [Kibdelosporangium banguiense]|uniref:Carboxypeptidase regulatory-like domain-containing protein n=1 Tax=Kibdelosporangium banguiense TaxID=1365924 RepID=A0ABS4T7M2_9PSEU|nr:hypothetical protein [Kibdelosporangium banguiense]MBP2319871.1 hypothetical protein [Kibdelosporangium banguiense]